MRAQESYIDTPNAQVTAPGLCGGFLFRGLYEYIYIYMYVYI